MLVLVIVLAVIVLLAVLVGFGGFGYGGGYGPDQPTVYRRIIHRRPPRRVVTERRVVEDSYGDGPVYRP